MTFAGGCDDEGIREPQCSVSSPQACGGRGDADVQVNHLDGQAPTEIVDELDGVVTSSSRPDEALGERGGRHREPVGSVEGLGYNRAGGNVVGVVGVEEPDEHAGVEVN